MMILQGFVLAVLLIGICVCRFGEISRAAKRGAIWAKTRMAASASSGERPPSSKKIAGAVAHLCSDLLHQYCHKMTRVVWTSTE